MQRFMNKETIGAYARQVGLTSQDGGAMPFDGMTETTGLGTKYANSAQCGAAREDKQNFRKDNVASTLYVCQEKRY